MQPETLSSGVFGDLSAAGGWALVAAAGLALLYWGAFCHAPASWPKTAVKTVSVLLLGLAAWMAGGAGLLVAALLLCALGDYLLSRDTEAQFMAGVAAFALGHIAYVWLFLSHPLARPELLAAMPRIAAVALLALVGLAMAAVLWPRAGALRGPVMAYIPIILSMGAAVLALPPQGPLAFAHVAAVLFILSDMTLSMQLFVWREGQALRRLAPYVVWPTYWLAQLGFALAFAPVAVK